MDPSKSTWLEPYRSAILELDPKKLPAALAAAQNAVERRLHELLDAGSEGAKERQELTDALQNVRALKRDLKTGSR